MAAEPQPEIYDDADLYEQLLKELVDGGGGGGVGGGGGGGGLSELQRTAGRRSAKLHRVVDRKARKGRKTRYTVQVKSPHTRD